MKQTRAEMAKIMLDYAEGCVLRCRKTLLLSECDVESTRAGNTRWAKENPMDGVGGFSQNPYDIGHSEMMLRLHKQDAEKAEQLWAFAKETFLGMIPG